MQKDIRLAGSRNKDGFWEAKCFLESGEPDTHWIHGDILHNYNITNIEDIDPRLRELIPTNLPFFTLSDEYDFKKHFASAFIATWCANNYADYCTRGMHKELGEPPIEDAEHLAEKAWEHAVKLLEIS